jgi:hypothetical protein
MRFKVLAVLAAAVVSAAAVTPAQACLACIAMPTDSLADHVTGAEIVALLRPSAGNPFLFAPVGFLRGGPDAPDVPFLVSRDRAAAMAADPAAVVVATWTTTGGWALGDMGGTDLVETLRAVLASDMSNVAARRDLFAPLIQDADPALSRMAMIELATLPYPVLRESAVQVNRPALVSLLSDPLWADWASIMILAFGLSHEPEDIAFVRRATGAMAESGRTVHLAAWATALLEMDEDAGLAWVRANYIDGSLRSEVELREISLALASHAQRDDAFGLANRDVLADFAASQPAVAGALARVLMEREDWSLATTFARWLDTGRITAPDDAFLITHYVLAAAEAKEELIR